MSVLYSVFFFPFGENRCPKVNLSSRQQLLSRAARRQNATRAKARRQNLKDMKAVK